jgi:hypothetical protein
MGVVFTDSQIHSCALNRLKHRGTEILSYTENVSVVKTLCSSPALYLFVELLTVSNFSLTIFFFSPE